MIKYSSVNLHYTQFNQVNILRLQGYKRSKGNPLPSDYNLVFKLGSWQYHFHVKYREFRSECLKGFVKCPSVSDVQKGKYTCRVKKNGDNKKMHKVCYVKFIYVGLIQVKCKNKLRKFMI